MDLTKRSFYVGLAKFWFCKDVVGNVDLGNFHCETNFPVQIPHVFAPQQCAQTFSFRENPPVTFMDPSSVLLVDAENQNSEIADPVAVSDQGEFSSFLWSHPDHLWDLRGVFSRGGWPLQECLHSRKCPLTSQSTSPNHSHGFQIAPGHVSRLPALLQIAKWKPEFIDVSFLVALVGTCRSLAAASKGWRLQSHRASFGLVLFKPCHVPPFFDYFCRLFPNCTGPCLRVPDWDEFLSWDQKFGVWEDHPVSALERFRSHVSVTLRAALDYPNWAYTFGLQQFWFFTEPDAGQLVVGNLHQRVFRNLRFQHKFCAQLCAQTPAFARRMRLEQSMRYVAARFVDRSEILILDWVSPGVDLTPFRPRNQAQRSLEDRYQGFHWERNPWSRLKFPDDSIVSALPSAFCSINLSPYPRNSLGGDIGDFPHDRETFLSSNAGRVVVLLPNPPRFGLAAPFLGVPRRGLDPSQTSLDQPLALAAYWPSDTPSSSTERGKFGSNSPACPLARDISNSVVVMAPQNRENLGLGTTDRSMRQIPAPAAVPPSVIGVDSWRSIWTDIRFRQNHDRRSCMPDRIRYSYMIRSCHRRVHLLPTTIVRDTWLEIVSAVRCCVFRRNAPTPPPGAVTLFDTWASICFDLRSRRELLRDLYMPDELRYQYMPPTPPSGVFAQANRAFVGWRSIVLNISLIVRRRRIMEDRNRSMLRDRESFVTLHPVCWRPITFSDWFPLSTWNASGHKAKFFGKWRGRHFFGFRLLSTSNLISCLLAQEADSPISSAAGYLISSDQFGLYGILTNNEPGPGFPNQIVRHMSGGFIRFESSRWVVFLRFVSHGLGKGFSSDAIGDGPPKNTARTASGEPPELSPADRHEVSCLNLGTDIQVNETMGNIAYLGFQKFMDAMEQQSLEGDTWLRSQVADTYRKSQFKSVSPWVRVSLTVINRLSHALYTFLEDFCNAAADARPLMILWLGSCLLKLPDVRVRICAGNPSLSMDRLCEVVRMDFLQSLVALSCPQPEWTVEFLTCPIAVSLCLSSAPEGIQVRCGNYRWMQHDPLIPLPPFRALARNGTEMYSGKNDRIRNIWHMPFPSGSWLQIRTDQTRLPRTLLEYHRRIQMYHRPPLQGPFPLAPTLWKACTVWWAPTR